MNHKLKISVDYPHPIIKWTDADVWQYIRENDVPYCSLYDEGWKRLGCVMCPMGMERQRRAQMERWPSIGRAYQRAATKAWQFRKDRGDDMTWKSGEAYFEWWISDRRGERDEQQRFVFD